MRTLYLCVLCALPACEGGVGTDDTGVDDTGDGLPAGPVLIQEIEADCDPFEGALGTWTYRVTTDGWTSDGLLNIDQDTQPAWSEEHILPSVDFDDNGAWDLLELVLPVVADFSDQEANVNTLFDCEDNRIDTMMWLVRVWDQDNNLSDCVVWGDDVSVYANLQCENANDWVNPPTAN
jgi:hypothetical protein